MKASDEDVRLTASTVPLPGSGKSVVFCFVWFVPMLVHKVCVCILFHTGQNATQPTHSQVMTSTDDDDETGNSSSSNNTAESNAESSSSSSSSAAAVAVSGGKEKKGKKVPPPTDQICIIYDRYEH